MSNNFTRTADFWTTLDDDYGNYTPTNNGRSVTIFPFGTRWRTTYDPWQMSGGRLITASSGLVSFPPQQPLAFSNLGRDTLIGYRWPLTQSSPNIPFEQDSRMTQEEQNNVLKKLRKEVYNPPPKNTFIRRLCLYYRDHGNNSNIVNQRAKDDDEEVKSCAVCLEDFAPRETVMLTPCNHMFHEDCIVPWVKSHGKCPVCRHQLHDPVPGNVSSFTNNNGMNIEANDVPIEELLSIIRSMEETMISRNRAR